MRQDKEAPEFLTVEIKDSKGKPWGILHAMPYQEILILAVLGISAQVK